MSDATGHATDMLIEGEGMAWDDTGSDEDKPVTRRDCGLVHAALAREVYASIRQFKWFIGISTTVLCSLVVFGLGMIERSVPKEIPPAWFVSRVERLETRLDRDFQKLETQIESHIHRSP